MNYALAALSLWVAFFMSPAIGNERPPFAGTAVARGQGPVQAWYGKPTHRYDHGVLGDAIEGGSLTVVDDNGHKYELILSDEFVFEDITPRIADLDGDGQNEVITIRTSLVAGAAVAVYQIRDGKLSERASTKPLGSSHRWLSIAGIADFIGDGRQQIAIVKTPHIGGILEVLSLGTSELISLYPPQTGYSTHYIGAKFVSLAVVGQIFPDRPDQLILPDQSRRSIFVLGLSKGVKILSSKQIPSRVIQPLQIDRQGKIIVALESGKTIAISIKPHTSDLPSKASTR